jgi:hypothetical protein
MTKAEAILNFRWLTAEYDTGVVPDTTTGSLIGIDVLLQRGAEALNRRVGYFFKDSTITLTAGAESALPDDMIEPVFVTLDGFTLKATDIEQLNQAEPQWRNKSQGLPREYFVYSKIGFYPPPDTASAALTCTMRHLATPTISTTPGFDLLATQDHMIPVYYAAALWFEAHGLDGDGFRAKSFTEMFEREAGLVKGYYEKRRLQRGPERGN